MKKYLVILPWVALLLTGCATIYERTSLSGSAPKSPYPALRTDLRYITFHCDPESLCGGWNGYRKIRIDERVLAVVFATLDIPISIFTDTFFLGLDLSTAKQAKAESDKDANPE
ncbi:MAG: hypothetical protein BWX73_00057 [Lentisphaerae bacterium ADurb.Bin082]|nr:MAG: hypothetical protein BWX73_00057 [Lentisphaerae bacterium ADurb.Bin082]